VLLHAFLVTMVSLDVQTNGSGPIGCARVYKIGPPFQKYALFWGFRSSFRSFQKYMSLGSWLYFCYNDCDYWYVL